jgi:hypothetical protein
MALTRDSALFYWHATYGLAPVVGGDPVFSRDSAGTMQDRQGALRSLIRNLPRHEWATVDGVTRPALLLELAATNLATRSEPTKAQLASATAGVSDSSIEGFAAAVRIAGGTGANEAAYLSHSFATSTTYVVSVLVEMEDGTAPVLGASTGAGDFSMVIAGALAGNNLRVRQIGRRLYRVSATYTTGTSITNNFFGVTRYTGQSQKSFTISGFQLEQRNFATAYIKTEGSTVTRATDQFRWNGAPKPQAKAVYLRLIQGMINDGGILNPRWLQIGAAGNTHPRLILHPTGADLKVFLQNDSGASADILIAQSTAVGDEVELLYVLSPDSSGRLIVSKNGGAVVGAGHAAVSGGIPTKWSANEIWLNSVGTISVGAGVYSEFKIVKQGDLVATTDQGRMDELRDYVLDPAGNLI